MKDEKFEESNKKVHPVEEQWHYPILTKFGFRPITKEGIGFVRSYDYEHPSTGRRIRCATGYSSDYWRELPPGKDVQGFWSDLEPHLKSDGNVKA